MPDQVKRRSPGGLYVTAGRNKWGEDVNGGRGNEIAGNRWSQ